MKTAPDKKHAHYFKDVSRLTEIDLYRVFKLFEVTDPCLQHAAKKIMCAGQRGTKDLVKDITEARDTMIRALAMIAEDAVPVEWPEDDERIENIGRNGGEPHYAEAEGWIEWADGQCPVAPDTVVDFIMRNGDECLEGCRAFDLAWENSGISYDIIAYRIHKN